jgi:hypothetical protein
MPVTLEVREEGRVLYMTISDPWSVQDILAIQPRTHDLFAKAQHKIHTLVHVTARSVPSGMLTARPSSGGLSRPSEGQIVIVGAPALLKAIAEVMFKIAKFTRSSFFDTEEEAWRYLQDILAHE